MIRSNSSHTSAPFVDTVQAELFTFLGKADKSEEDVELAPTQRFEGFLSRRRNKAEYTCPIAAAQIGRVQDAFNARIGDRAGSLVLGYRIECIDVALRNVGCRK